MSGSTTSAKRIRRVYVESTPPRLDGAPVAGKETVGHKQLWPMARRLNVTPIAEELAEKIMRSEEDQRLTWKQPGRQVRVHTHKAIGADKVVTQTATSRSKRLVTALQSELEPVGWRYESRGSHHYFVKSESGRDD